MNNPIVIIVVALMGGGLLGAVASLITSSALAKRTKVETAITIEKAPVEIDSLVVQGAETAVLTMKEALLDARARIQQLEQERAADRAAREADAATIAELRQQVADIRTQAQECETKLNNLVSDRDARE